jgi:hypothetical protein
MDQTAFPFEPEEPELALEPVIGWRIWRLRRSPRTGLVLESPLRPQPWPPGEPMRARCPAAGGRGRPPHERCMCGLYAASSAERLRVAGVTLAGPACSVIGTVAMWGRVIEHQMGYRGELGYPDRIRLVCAACLRSMGSALPTRVFSGPTGELIAACEVHGPDQLPLEISPDELQSQLLSTYSVDLLPLEALPEPALVRSPVRPAVLLHRPPSLGRRLVTEARREARELVGTREGRLGILALVVTFFVLRALGVLTSPTIPRPEPTPTPLVQVSPLPGPGDPIRVPIAEPDDRQTFPDIAILCGRREGDVIIRARCAAPGAELLGFASHPAEARGACEMEGYTRKGRYSVCWIDPSIVETPAHPLRWRLPGAPFGDLFGTVSGS